MEGDELTLPNLEISNKEHIFIIFLIKYNFKSSYRWPDKHSDWMAYNNCIKIFI